MSTRPIHLSLLTALALLTVLKGQTINTAIAVDAAGTEYTGGAGATVSKTDGWQIRLGNSDADLVRALVLTPDGSLFAAGSIDGGGFIAHISAKGERTGWLALDRAARAIALDTKEAIYAGGDGFFEKLNPQLEPISTIRVNTAVAAIAVRSDGLVFVAQDSTLFTYSPEGDVVGKTDLGTGSTITGIALDPSGAIYVTGSTNALNLPASRNRLNGPADAFVAKIDANGSTVEWSTYLGGSGVDAAAAIARRPDGTLVIAGYTTSPDFPGVSGGQHLQGGEDGFVAQLDPLGNVIESSYWGTAGNDRLEALALDARGKIHVAGKSDQASKGLQPHLQPTNTVTLDTSLLLEGPASGTDSVIVLCTCSWTPTVDADSTSWLVVNTPSGTGNGVVTFSFTANTGGVRSTFIHVNNTLLFVVQAGNGYQPASVVTLANFPQGSKPHGVALDSAGNIYMPEGSLDTAKLYQWTVVNQQLTPVLTGLHSPIGVTVDPANNIDFTYYNHDNVPNFFSAIQQWSLSTNSVSTLVNTGSSVLGDVKADTSGNLYYTTASGTNQPPYLVNKVAPDLSISTLYSDASLQLEGLAVDAIGNVFFVSVDPASQASTVREYSGSVSTVISSGLNNSGALAVDAGDNLYISDAGSNSLKKWAPGSPTALSTVPGLGAPQGVAVDGGGNIFFTDLGPALRELPRAYISQTSLSVGTGSGSGSIQVVPADLNLNGIYAPVSSDPSWLTFGARDSNGVVPFSYTANNTGLPRSATITILGVTNTITQDVPRVATTIQIGAGNNQRAGINQQFATNLVATVFDQTSNPFPNASVIFTVVPGTGLGSFGGSTTYTAVSTSNGFATAGPLTASAAGSFTVTATVAGTNISETFNLTVVTLGLSITTGNNQRALINQAFPSQLQVAIFDQNANPTPNVPVTFTVPSTAGSASGVFAGNNPTHVIVNTGSDGSATAPVLTANSVAGSFLVTASAPSLGTVTYTLTNFLPLAITAGNNQGTPVNSQFVGNLWVTAVDSHANPMANAPVIFTINPGMNGASATFAGATPSQATVTTDVSGVGIAPTLTANGIAGSFTVTATANGNSVTFNLTNIAASFALLNSSILEGPGSGSDSVQVIATGAWTATANDTWLHLAQGSLSGSANGIVAFTFDQNAGSTRTGTLTVAGITFLVTQAGASYVPAGVTTLISSGLSAPWGVAAKPDGTVYIADTGTNTIKQWNPSSQTLSVVGPQPSFWTTNGNNYQTRSVAVRPFDNDDVFLSLVDNSGNTGGAFTKWNFVLQQFVGVGNTPSYSTDKPQGLAVTATGSTYYTTPAEAWVISGQSTSGFPAVGGLTQASGIAVDAAANLYIADTGSNAIMIARGAPNYTLSSLISGLSGPYDVGMDGGANLYIADTGNSAIKKWTNATGSVSTLASLSLSNIHGLAADPSGNIYFSDYTANAVSELSRAYISTATFNEGGPAGSDSLEVVPASQNLTGVFAPSSDASWLTIGTVSNGVVNSSFTSNGTGVTRTGHLTLLGLTIPVTQVSAPVPNTLQKTLGDNQNTAVGQRFGPLQVKVLDQFSNPLQGVTVTFSVTAGQGGASGSFSGTPSQTITTDANGLATASGLTANGVGGSFTVTASVASPIGNPNAIFTLTNLSPTTLSKTQGDTQSVSADQPFAPLQVKVLGQFNNPVQGVPVTFSVTAGQSGASGTFATTPAQPIATDANGLATSPVVTANGMPGTFTVSALAGSLSQSFNLTITLGAASQLVFTTQPPSSAAAGQTFGAVVKIEDSNGNVVSTSTAQVTIGTTSVNAVAGVATFTSLAFNTAGSYTLTATASGLTNAVSTQITITAAAASQLVFTTQPNSGTAGQALTPAPVVSVEDQYNNVVTTSVAAVTIGSAVVNATAGVATFNNVVFDTAGNYTLVATSPNLANATSNQFTITAGTGSQLVFATQPPSSAMAGQTFGAVVKIEDSNGNVVSTSTAQVAIGSTSVNAVAGVATFTSLSFNTAGSYTLTATSSGLSNAVSTQITITAGAASQLVFTTQPNSGTAGQALTPAPVVSVEDQYNNVVTTSVAPVTIGSATVNATAGMATFNNVVFATAGNYTLLATSPGLASATSNQFTITAGTGSQLVFATQPPSSATAGQTFGAVVKIEDSNGNVVSSSIAQVTIGTTSVNAVAGVATFTSLAFNTAGNYTLTATASGLTNAVSTQITITAAAASQLVFTTQPNSGTAGQALTPAPVVSVEDQYNNVVTTSVAPVTIGSAIVNATAGVATFNNVVFDTAGNYTLLAASPGLANAASNQFTITAGTGSQLVFATQPPSSAMAGQTFGAVVKIEDSNGNVVPTSIAQVTIGTTSVNAVAGVATFTGLAFNTAGNYTLTATASGVSNAVSTQITITAAAASQLVFTTQPNSGTAGQALTPAPVVSVEDQYNNVVTTSVAAVTIGSAVVNATAGVATFNNVVFATAGNYTLLATSPGLANATSNQFTITAGTGSQLVFATQPPSSATAGQTFGAVVKIEDSNGNVVSTSTAQVTIGTTSVNAVAGVATFTGLAFNTAGNYTLTATASGVSNAVSTQITITAAAASQLVFTTQPNSGTAGQALTPAPVVSVEDQYNNVVTTSVAAVTIGSAVVNATAGVATFNNVVFATAGNYTLLATSPGLANATSNQFTITAGTGSQLVFATQPPSSATAGQTFGAVVKIEDSNGNVVSTSTAQVAIGTTSVNAVAGVATFTSLSFNTAGSYTLTATSSGLTNAVSTQITITAAAASQLVFTTQPNSGTAGQALTPAPVVSVEDQYNNMVTTSVAPVTIGSATMNATAGVATFNNVVFATAGNYTLLATSPGLANATSNQFTITAGTGSQLVFTTQPPSSAAAGQTFGAVVKIEDSNGNVVSTSTAQVTIGTTSVNAVAGVATFTGLAFNTVDSYTLTAASQGLTNAVSTPITITAAAATKLVFTTQPNSGTAGQALTPAPVVSVEDQYNNVVTTSVIPVTIGSATVNAVSGVATFNNLVFAAAGNYTLLATSPNLTSAASNQFTITAGTGSQLVFATQPPSSATAGQTFGAVVKIEDSNGNVVSTSTAQVTIGTTSVNAVAGVATFTSLVFNTAGSYALTATSQGLANAVSTQITITAAAATKG